MGHAGGQETEAKKHGSTASKDELRLRSRLVKTIRLLAADPFHPGLQSHEISALTRICGFRVFQSYLENDNPRGAAYSGRMGRAEA